MTPDDVDPRQWIANQMHVLGFDSLLPADEETQDSVWVEEDRAPHRKAGYYVARRIAARHSLTFTGNAVTLRFVARRIPYAMSCSQGTHS